ncbi:hypothetical protein E8E13_000917 [Curvularia kusanoi]|uniref:Uncharacterized protein n=1 Tax=Curvularia kusanoi TaxID=90978 RepID=A0A9P4T2L1_CURKU|nr:hypothetical protein E8E13_000917 [Curvularia kusanoi]
MVQWRLTILSRTYKNRDLWSRCGAPRRAYPNVAVHELLAEETRGIMRRARRYENRAYYQHNRDIMDRPYTPLQELVKWGFRRVGKRTAPNLRLVPVVNLTWRGPWQGLDNLPVQNVVHYVGGGVDPDAVLPQIKKWISARLFSLEQLNPRWKYEQPDAHLVSAAIGRVSPRQSPEMFKVFYTDEQKRGPHTIDRPNIPTYFSDGYEGGYNGSRWCELS